MDGGKPRVHRRHGPKRFDHDHEPDERSHEPAVTGPVIRFTASAGGAPRRIIQVVVQSGGVWTVAQEWSNSTTLTWQPTAGTHMVAVWGRNAV